MLEHVRAASGERLGADDYLARFWEVVESGIDFIWKLERLQHFREPGDKSWEAFDRGDWDEALRLTEDEAPEIMQQAQQEQYGVQRIRIVELPLSPYLLWEFQFLKIRTEAGSDIRILGPDAIAHLERDGELPEVVGLGNTVLFEVLYDSSGTLDGARQIKDPDLIVACRREFENLFARGEPLSTFFEREVAGKRPPALEAPGLVAAKPDIADA
jgi:hypothetical protein